jgi:hypothetical protein
MILSVALPLRGMARKWGRMNDAVAVLDEEEGGAALRPPRAFYRRKRWAIPLGVLALLLLTLATGWLARERIADNIIADTLKRNNIPATYKVDSIAPERQILRDIVVGNPARPDLTVAQAIVHLRYRWGRPEITRVEIVSPRLYGAGGTGGSASERSIVTFTATAMSHRNCRRSTSCLWTAGRAWPLLMVRWG